MTEIDEPLLLTQNDRLVEEMCAADALTGLRRTVDIHRPGLSKQGSAHAFA